MAYITETVGVYSELIAEAALMAAGYVGVARPTTREYYDLIATDRFTGKDVKFQVKTLKRRDKDGDWFVIYAKNGAGKAYGVDQASDYYIGVLVDDGETPRVFLAENDKPTRKELWCKTDETNEKWTEIPIAFDRRLLKEMAIESVAQEIDAEFRKVGV